VALPNTDVTPLAGTGSFTVYTPAQVRHGYGFDRLSFNGAGQTIAIVAAYDDPNAYADLIRFDRAFRLADPPAFVKATPQGMPAANAAWAGEIALDVEWAHAVAPGAKILLVEAKSANIPDLLAAVDYARNYPGVSVVSMSWGGPEFFNEASFDTYFLTPAGHMGGGGRAGGITFVASAGDSGAWYGPEWPAVSPSVLAVGGTALRLTADGTYLSESGWAGSGGGYSKYDMEPAYQSAAQHTGRRSNPDVAYNADPSAGVYVYDSYTIPSGYSGWYSYAGTSAGAPQWAALIALADQGRASYGLGSIANAQATVYALPANDFHPIAGGYNGYSVTNGYNPVTGLGSPFADRVVLGLISAGSSTLTVKAIGSGGAQAGTAHGLSDSMTAVFRDGPLDQTQLAVLALAVGDTAARTPSPPSDVVFIRHEENASPTFPAITRLDEAVHNVWWDLFGGHADAAEGLIDPLQDELTA
jgi:subtilase family serine protease